MMQHKKIPPTTEAVKGKSVRPTQSHYAQKTPKRQAQWDDGKFYRWVFHKKCMAYCIFKTCGLFEVWL